MEQRQVIVVGSGPSGAACAKALTEEGIDVLVIDKARLPRHKTCSGILFGQTQVLLRKYFGSLPPAEVYCRPEIIRAADILEWHRDGTLSPYVWELPKNGEDFPSEYHNVWRSKFDHWLLQMSGADYRDNCRLHKFAEESGKIRVTVVSRGGEKAREVLCSYLIGADGCSSRVRHMLAPADDEQGRDCVVCYGYYRFSDLGLLQDGHWYVFLHPDFGDIIACVHRKDDFLAATVGGFKGCDLKAYGSRFEDFLARHGRVVLQAKAMETACTLKMGPICLGQGNVLLAGDAAGLIYLNGEGISVAIDSGYRAGKAIAAAVKSGADALARYRQSTADILAHMQRCMEKSHFLVPKEG